MAKKDRSAIDACGAALAVVNDRFLVDLRAAAGDPALIARAQRRHDLAALVALLRYPYGHEESDRCEDALLDRILGIVRPAAEAPRYTRDLTTARTFVAAALPGFWVSSGLCDLTGHASLGPDYNGARGERLHREWPLDVEGFVGTWDEDLAPGDGVHRECRAILTCACRALAYQHERPPRARAADLPAVVSPCA
ncbi:hypothetical protein MKK68_19510 [Methylobacterium sp. E-016]|uniref:hypothetical protein n=1 Tax=Methylobacterium sp. E-016 TaxID=2836556 RepID=UPI001FBA78DF|nr:hypothetical protein [Methylobacterium sp. E-016]MCJ2077804.1 hypothetical protein [Methylobacterium sp. E-016]